MDSPNSTKKLICKMYSRMVVALQCCAIIAMTNCGKGEGETKSVQQDAASPSGPVSKSATAVQAEPELQPLDHPASPAEAARYIDLSTLPAMDGADQPQGRAVANLSYRVAAGVKAVYEFHKKQLAAQKWKELSEGTSVTDEYASGTFERCGFHVSMLVSPGGAPGKVDVIMHNHGNVDLAKLPLPTATEKVYAGAITLMHVTESPVAATTAECRNLMLAQGWEPYGSAGDSAYYRRNGVRLQVNAVAAPAQGGKTMITYSCDQMSADMPAPADAEDVRYADTQRHLTFFMAGGAKAVAASYKDVAMKSGWKPNREETFRDDDKDVMVFRNPTGDMMWMEIKDRSGKSAVTLKYQTGAEIAAMDAKLDAQAAAHKEKMKADLAKTVLTLALPSGAKIVSQSPNEVKLTLESGFAVTAADAWNDKLHETGWLLSSGTRQGGVGSMALRRDGQTLTIDFDDSDAAARSLAVRSTGVGVEVK